MPAFFDLRRDVAVVCYFRASPNVICQPGIKNAENIRLSDYFEFDVFVAIGLLCFLSGEFLRRLGLFKILLVNGKAIKNTEDYQYGRNQE